MLVWVKTSYYEIGCPNLNYDVLMWNRTSCSQIRRPKLQKSCPKVQSVGLNDRRRGKNGVVPRLCRLEFYPWHVLPRWTGSVTLANDWTSANFSRVWWSLGIAARWMWLMQHMNLILKISGIWDRWNKVPYCSS